MRNFSIASLLIFTAVVAICLTRITDVRFYPRQTIQVFTVYNGHSASISYGFRRHRWDETLNQLDFVAMQNETRTNTMKGAISVHKDSDRYHDVATLTYDTGIIELPATTQLHEVTNGKYNTLPETVTYNTFLRWLKNAKSATIDDLLKFKSETNVNDA